MAKFLCITYSGVGGAEKNMVLYSKILAETGHDVKMVIFKKKNDGILKYIPSNIERIEINCTKSWLLYHKLYKIIKKEKPDVIYSSLTALSLMAIILKLFIGKYKIIARQCFTPGSQSRLIEFCISTFFSKADVNIAQTDEMRDLMIKNYKLKSNKVLVINNPIDTDDIDRKTSNIQKIDKTTNRFVAVGRVCPDKDYLTMIKAFSIVAKNLSDATLIIVGNYLDSHYKATCDTLISELGLQNMVKFVGATDNPFQFVASSDVYLLTSVSEGLPNAMIEAMYLNTPVVATKCIPFISLKIRDGINGYTCEVGDYQGIADAMLKAQKLKGSINNPLYNSAIKKRIVEVFESTI